MYLFYIRHLCREEEGIKAAGFELDAEVIIMDRYANTVARQQSPRMFSEFTSEMIIILYKLL
jgi:hypothetical protein